MRNPPPALPEKKPEESRRADPDVIVMKREYRLLTPLYGGGVQPGVVDQKTPIHGTGVRGQLRFWWRATRGGRFNGDMAAMRLAEDQLWGSTQRGSLVTIAVTRCSSGQELRARDTHGQPVDVGAVGSPYSYVAFPLRESHGKVYEGITFDLELTLPAGDKAITEDVQAALWAWETFGGVGARTRRGFGALHCRRVTPCLGSATFNTADWRWEYDCASAEARLREDVEHFVLDGHFHTDVPRLSRTLERYKLTNPHSNALKVWEHLFGELQNFRQNRPKKRYGRSNWPEPDVIRDYTNQRLDGLDHDQPVYDPIIEKFPRADFGLPILFGFHPDHKPDEDDELNPDRDPRDTTLQGTDHDRLASPLILRPLACANGRYVGLALILEARRVPPGGLVLKGTALTKTVQSTLDDKEARRIAAKHTWRKMGIDVLQYFLDGMKKDIGRSHER